MGLQKYNAKRDFKRTKEPKGKPVRSEGKDDFFVVQKHAASRLHYDFRLEMDGVLKSWAVPKGFPWKKGDKRLAVHVEDHPISYAQFEGTIPPGNYGAGTVMVWDIGRYEVGGGKPLAALKEGKLHLFLSGKKLKGEWALIRLKGSTGDNKENWLILKAGSDVPPISARADDQSALTKRSMKQIGRDNDAQWESNRNASDKPKPKGKALAPAPKPVPGPNLSKLPKAAVSFVAPMKCVLMEKIPKGPDWIYEIKFDGYRALALKQGNQVRLLSRNKKELSYPLISEAVKYFPADEATLDGEIVAVDKAGKSSFQLLQAVNLPGPEKPSLLYYAFDLLTLDGKDLKSLPLMKRKGVLQSLIPDQNSVLRFSSSIEGAADVLLKEVKRRGLEGVIAKQKVSKYRPGVRSSDWVKVKVTNEQEFVIGGYTRPQGARAYFGALLVAFYEKGQLLFASKVGTGFDFRLLESLYRRFQPLRIEHCPFSNLPAKRGGRWSPGLTAGEMKRCTWLEPKLVCQVRFTEWTRDGNLRQPVFLGIREDKKPTEVVRERPA